MSCYFDSIGLVLIEKDKPTENGVLFTTEYWLSEYIKKGYLTADDQLNIRNIVNRVDNIIWFDPNPIDNNNPSVHFSHDNMTGLYILYYLLKDKSYMFLPTVVWNNTKALEDNSPWYRKLRYALGLNNRWLRHTEIIFYSIMKEKKWSYCLSWVLGLSSLFTCLGTQRKTSGKCLWWLRLRTMMIHPNKFIQFNGALFSCMCEMMLSIAHGKIPWVDIFTRYITTNGEKDNLNNPILKNMREIYVYDSTNSITH